MFILKNLKKYKDSLITIKNSLKIKSKDRELERKKINTLLINITLCLNEGLFLEPSFYQQVSNIKEDSENILKLYRELETENQEENEEEIKNNIDIIKTLIDSIVENIEECTKSLENRSYFSFPFKSQCDNNVIRNILDNIEKGSPIRIFYNQCDRDNFYACANTYDKFELYGINNSGTNIKNFEHTKKIIKGRIVGSRITNDMFDVIYINPHISPYVDENTSDCYCMNSEKIEKDHICSDLKYLKKNGIAIIKIPFFRLHQDICKCLSRYLEDIEILRSQDSSENAILYIVGKKNTSIDIKKEEFEKIRKAGLNYRTQKTLMTRKFKIPESKFELTLFKGSKIDMEEIEEIMNKTGCFKDFVKEINKDTSTTENLHPLLPFNIGQIGLVLTSGCLDGIVDEQDDECHIIKGRVRKEIKKETIHSEEGNKEIETVSNKVEINLLLPDGTMKTLT